MSEVTLYREIGTKSCAFFGQNVNLPRGFVGHPVHLPSRRARATGGAVRARGGPGGPAPVGAVPSVRPRGVARPLARAVDRKSPKSRVRRNRRLWIARSRRRCARCERRCARVDPIPAQPPRAGRRPLAPPLRARGGRARDVAENGRGAPRRSQARPGWPELGWTKRRRSYRPTASSAPIAAAASRSCARAPDPRGRRDLSAPFDSG